VIDLNKLNAWRFVQPGHWAGDETCGAFLVPYLGQEIVCIASSNHGWDHVSCSLRNRTPRWNEMDFIKRTFFLPHEVAIQIHPAEADHVNVHPFCLHLWRSQLLLQPLPPKEFV
jgi:hypothetical protein